MIRWLLSKSEAVTFVGTFRNLSKWGSQFFKAEERAVENVPTVYVKADSDLSYWPSWCTGVEDFLIVIFILIFCVLPYLHNFDFFPKFREEIDAGLIPRRCPWFCLVEKKNMINFSQGNWWPGWDLTILYPRDCYIRPQDTVSPLRRPDAGNSCVPHPKARSNFNAASGFLNNSKVFEERTLLIYMTSSEPVAFLYSVKGFVVRGTAQAITGV